MSSDSTNGVYKKHCGNLSPLSSGCVAGDTEELELAETMEEAPPKPEWKAAKDDGTGRLYYFHRLTKKTTWTKPEKFDKQQKAYKSWKKTIISDDMHDDQHTAAAATGEPPAPFDEAEGTKQEPVIESVTETMKEEEAPAAPVKSDAKTTATSHTRSTMSSDGTKGVHKKHRGNLSPLSSGYTAGGTEELALAETVEETPSKPEWKAVEDDDTGRLYYFHRLTKKTTWTKPEKFDEQQKAYKSWKKRVIGDDQHTAAAATATGEPPAPLDEAEGPKQEPETVAPAIESIAEMMKEEDTPAISVKWDAKDAATSQTRSTVSKDSTSGVYKKHRGKVMLASGLTIVCVALAVAIPLVVLKGGGDDDKKSSSVGSFNSEAISPPPTTGLTSVPTTAPSTSPSGFPSGFPSDFPSGFPSASPSGFPSESPTYFPTALPTAFSESPTGSPSASPTGFFVEPNPVPANPRRGYFNYDMNDERYGPNAWEKVDTSNHFSMREFSPNGWGTWKNSLQVDPTKNRCHDYRHWRSPKNLVQEDGGGGRIDGICDAHHEIRTKCGSFSIESDNYKKYILPHKLTVVMNRRQCRDLSREECRKDRPPVADYPKYSSGGSGLSDLMNWDIKVPGEHKIYNETFDAEIQMMHAHLDNQKLNSLGIPIRATEDGHNADFQRILDQFHVVYDRDTQACLNQNRNLRQQDTFKYYEDLMEQGKREGWYNDHTARVMTDPEFMRQLQVPSDFRFNPYSKNFMVDMFFFRYRGSMTEPPCMFLSWWVMDTPMSISFDQLRQIKFLLFTHVDPETCEKTSVHNADQSVTRPVQPIGDHEETGWVQHCIAGTFASDLDRFGEPGRKCD